MPEALAYLNDRMIPADELVVAVSDAGFVQGVTVAEQMRTFGGKLFRLEDHLDRLRQSLDFVGVELGPQLAELPQLAQQLVEHNHRLLAEGDDLGLSVFVTPGPYATLAPHAPAEPTLAMHTYPLPFVLWARRYHDGQRVVVSDVRQVPSVCWSPALKCRSRMHYYLADRQARQRDPAARAILLDIDGYVSEASTANVLLYRKDEGLISPPPQKILPGISMACVAELAASMQVPFLHRDLHTEDLRQADEVLLCSTSPCVLAAVAVDGEPIGSGQPGAMFHRLLDAWSSHVGVDIVAQAIAFSER